MLPYLTVKMSHAFLGMGSPNPSCSLSRLCELVDALPWDMDEIKGRCRNCIATRIQLRFYEEIPVQTYVDNLSTLNFLYPARIPRKKIHNLFD